MFASFMTPRNALFDEFWRMHQDLEEALGEGVSASGGIRSLPRGSFPAVNVIQTPTELQVYLFAPGIDASKLDVSIQHGLLTVSGERQIPQREQATYYRQDRFSGQFSRAIALGDEVDPEQVDAKYRDGIVQITLKRRETARPRQIEIRTA